MIVVVAPPREPEENLLTQKPESDFLLWSYVTINLTGVKFNDAIAQNSIFLLINQQQNENKIFCIFENLKKSGVRIIVYTHRSETTAETGQKFPPISCENIKNNLGDNLLHCEPFSHGTKIPYLCFMEKFEIDRWEDNKKLLDSLVESYTVQNVYMLRSIVLTPLVGIDLLAQIKGSEDPSFVEAKKKIPDLMNAINAEMDQPAYKDALCKLEEVFGTTCPDFLKNIKTMIVDRNVIHSAFKIAAEKLEQAITALPK